jgi:hypothetical protein
VLNAVNEKTHLKNELTTMIKLKLTDKDKQIGFSYTGKYIVFFDGVYYASNKGDFKIEVKNNEDGTLVEVRVPFLKPTEYSFFHGRIQYAYLIIKKKGNYTINFKNIDNLKLMNTMIWPLWFILPSRTKPENVIVEIGR